MTKSESVILHAEDMSLGYGPHVVLRGVTLHVRIGEFWCLLGPNGAGKSTFLKAVLREIAPRAGRLHLSADYADRRQLGFVPQRCELNRAMPTTVREFVSLGLLGIAVDRAERQQRLRESLLAVGLLEKIGDSYWSLSGGQRQRALLARALIRRPRWLILDEPVSGLDLSAAESLVQQLAQINRKAGLTVLLVTHDVELAARFATNVALFHDQRVIAGAADDMLTDERLRQAYGVVVHVHHLGPGAATVRIGDPSGTERNP